MSDVPRRIAVTGATGYVGARLVRALELEAGVVHVLAIDVRPPVGTPGPKTSFLEHDVSHPFRLVLAGHDIDTVVHLAYVLRPSHDRLAAHRVNVGGTSNLLDACAEAGVRKIVYLSSTTVYGAHPDNPSMLTESSPARPVPGFQYSEDKAASEALVLEHADRAPDVAAAVLRCCPAVGPTADNFIVRAFLKPFLVKVRGADPPMQLIHEDDLIGCMKRCVLGEASGVYNLAGEGAVLWSEMAAMLGRRLVSLPAPLLYGATQAAWRLRLQRDSPASGLNFIRYPWVASTDKIKAELGVELRYSSHEAWESFAARHRGARR